MSSWGLLTPQQEPPDRRVREQVRDGVAVVVVSLLASSGVVVVLTVVSRLAG